ncbi:hypothetical protein [Niameybacter massiliensis]|uniref:hypothetical protein n=1 Tax=Niameybacter massiliensis TaxID=1658108 RepID=UPI0006B5267C|nr:hypothetical protein [Niameybacter massiliensis]
MDEDRIVQAFQVQMENIKKHDIEILAITHRHWLGVKHATQELFEFVIEIEDLNSYEQVVAIGMKILESHVKKIVISGFAAGWNTLCSYLKQQDAKLQITIFWHGNTTHMYEEYSWVRHYEILQLAKDHHIDQLALAKQNMCEVYKKLGISVIHLKNHVKKKEVVDKYQKRWSFNLAYPTSIGIYASGETWAKNAYTQIAAASLFHQAQISLIPANDRMICFANQLGITVVKHTMQLSRKAFQEELAKNMINFYVTFTECAPLLPLESLNQGVICLTGNNHHYFEEHPLRNWLVIEEVDSAPAIYKKAVKALEHRDEILNLYEEWYEDNERQVIESLKQI